MRVRIVVFLAACLVGASVAGAQEVAPPSQEQLNERFEELDRWLTLYRKWEKWIARYGNRPAKTGWGNVDSDRMQRPEPPKWLSDDCANVMGDEGKLGEACEILRQWHGLTWHLKRLADNPTLTTTSGVVNDKVVKTSFWQRVHLTGLWTPSQLPVPKVYGVVGMQIGVFEIGRVTVPALGVMLVTMTGRDGSREWKPATSIAASVRLFNINVSDNTVGLHFNVSRLSIGGARSIGPAGVDVTSNFVGLSLSFKKARP